MLASIRVNFNVPDVFFRNNIIHWLEIRTLTSMLYQTLIFRSVKYAGQGTIAVDNLLIYTRLSTANGQPGHLGCSEWRFALQCLYLIHWNKANQNIYYESSFNFIETDEQKSLIEIGGLDCVFNSTDTRNHTPTNEVLMQDGMCLWKNVISSTNTDRFAIATGDF